MALPLNILLRSIGEKATQLAQMQELMKARISELEEKNMQLETELKETKDLLDKALSDIEFLTVSHRLADSPDSIVSTRRHIARLIRNIDSCISMLKED